GIVVPVGDQDHVAALLAVAAVGAPARDAGLPPEGDPAVAAVARLDLEFRFVAEHGTERIPVSPAKARPFPGGLLIAGQRGGEPDDERSGGRGAEDVDG